MDGVFNDLWVDGRLRGKVNWPLSGGFGLPRLTAHTVTLSEDVTNFRWVHVLAGDDSINGLGLGVISVPLAEIPVASPAPQFVLYGATGGSDGRLYRLSTLDAAVLEDIGALGSAITGLGEAGAALYGAARFGNSIRIYSVDRLTGLAMFLALTDFSLSGTNISLGGAGGDLFGTAGTGSADIYQANLVTGALTQVRNDIVPSPLVALGGLDGVLYGIRDSGETLYSGLQPGGAVAAVGASGGVVNIRGLTGLNGVLYGIDPISGGSNLYSISVTTGVATLVGSNAVQIGSLAGIDIGVSPAVRLHIIPNVRVDMWRPTGTTRELGFYSEAATRVVQIVGIP